MTPTWTPMRERDLAYLWAQSDVSASTIASAMGLTVNQVIGKVHRLGLPKRANAIPGDGPEMRKRAAETRRLNWEAGLDAWSHGI